MKSLLLLCCLLPYAATAAELRTWTFSKDGKADVSGSEFTFRKGGRMDGLFVRFVETNDVVIKRLPDALNCRFAMSDLSSNDVAYLSRFVGESDRITKARLKELRGLDGQAEAIREENAERARQELDDKAKLQIATAAARQRDTDWKKIEALKAAIARAQGALDYEDAVTPTGAGGDPDYVNAVMAHRAGVNRRQLDINAQQKELEQMVDDFKTKYSQQ